MQGTWRLHHRFTWRERVYARQDEPSLAQLALRRESMLPKEINEEEEEVGLVYLLLLFIQYTSIALKITVTIVMNPPCIIFAL